MVERPEDRDLLGFRRPHRKVRALDTLQGRGMRAEFIVQVEMRTFVKEVEVVRREQTPALVRESRCRRSRIEMFAGAMIGKGVHRCRVLWLRADRQSAGDSVGRQWFRMGGSSGSCSRLVTPLDQVWYESTRSYGILFVPIV